jgi:hypothetical protein
MTPPFMVCKISIYYEPKKKIKTLLWVVEKKTKHPKTPSMTKHHNPEKKSTPKPTFVVFLTADVRLCCRSWG